MKKNRYITLSIVLLCLLAALAGGVRLFRYYLPHEGPTDALYEKYKDNPQVKASLLYDFRVNDTLAVDALLLEASTDSAWCALLLDFGMPKEMMEDYLSDKKSFEGTGTNIITLFTIDKNNPQKSLPREEPDSRVVSVSFAKKSLCVFMTEDKTIKETISDGEIHKINNKNNQK